MILNTSMRCLSEVLADQDMNQAIIFTATKRGADQLAEKLKDAGHRCAALHGDMRQGQRRRTIEQLSSKRLKVLVATDVAARGLDIKGISHVVNFDLPMQAEDYIHRIGRTGRGGATGTAISLVGPQDWGYLSRIEKLIESKLDLSVIAGLEPKKPRPVAIVISRIKVVVNLIFVSRRKATVIVRLVRNRRELTIVVERAGKQPDRSVREALIKSD